MRFMRCEQNWPLHAANAAQPPQAQPNAPVPGSPPLDERVQVAEQRVADLSQEKVEASQRFPISLTGMVLFNAFLNGKEAAGVRKSDIRYRYVRTRYERSDYRADGARFSLSESQGLVGRTGQRLAYSSISGAETARRSTIRLGCALRRFNSIGPTPA